MKSVIIIQKVHKSVRLLETEAGEAHASTAGPGGGSSEGAKKRGGHFMCRVAERRDGGIDSLVPSFTRQGARGTGSSTKWRLFGS